MEFFKPKINKDHKFAVVVPCEGGTMMMIETYQTKDELVENYMKWRDYALKSGITEPLPFEFIDDNNNGVILEELVNFLHPGASN